MDLDDLVRVRELDTQDMLGQIAGLPAQLQHAWELGQVQPLPDRASIRTVVLAGMGGSAIGADLVTAYLRPDCPVPAFVHRDYDLPGFASGPDTLVVCCSHSGNTEETLSSYRLARQRGCRTLVVATGGQLSQLAAQQGVPCWTFEHRGQPRAAIGFSFGLLLALFSRLGLAQDQGKALAAAAADMRAMQDQLRPEVPAARNPAKRYAGQLVGRIVTVVASGALAPVARRWKGQFNEIAKSAAGFEVLPEADHNTLQGTAFPEPALTGHTMTLFLKAPSDHPRNRLRSDLTRQAFMLEGLGTDFVEARGEGPLSHMWTLIGFGDYLAFYLAIANGVDPTPVPALESLKGTLNASP